MKPMLPIAIGAAVALCLVSAARATAQQEEQKLTPEREKELIESFKKAGKELNDRQKKRDLQAQALKNLDQIGQALFKFHADYGGFPSEKTVARVKEARGIKAELGAATANACFLQLIAAHLVEDPCVFTFEKPAVEAHDHDHAHHHHHHSVDKCSFALVSLPGMDGHPLQPLVVAPLVKGKTTFDPKVFGGNAVILRLDKSAVVAPISEDGRVMLEGKDLFDPGQSFWKGQVPPVKWPEG